MEGGNKKIPVLSRRAYGYSDEDYLKLVAAFLLPLRQREENAPLRSAKPRFIERNATNPTNQERAK